MTYQFKAGDKRKTHDGRDARVVADDIYSMERDGWRKIIMEEVDQ